MTIKAKMLAILGVVTLLLVGMTLSVDHQSGYFAELQQGRLSAMRLKTNILELRRAEKDFLARKDPKYLDSFNAKIHETEALSSRLIDRLDALSIDSVTVSTLLQGTREYARRFNSLAELQTGIGLNATSGLYGRLRQAVHDAEAIVKEHSDYELLTHMLMLRRAEKDFMLRRQPKYLDKFEQHFEKMHTALSRSTLGNREQATAQSQLDQYRKAFLVLADAEKTLGLTHKDGHLGQLRKTVHAVEDRLAAVDRSLEEAISRSEAEFYRTLYASMIAIILIITGLLSWMGLTIARRIGQVSHEMLQVAEGDGDLRRRLSDKGSDEITVMARAFNTFAYKIHDMLKSISERVTVLSETDDRVNDAAHATDTRMRELRSNTQSVVVATEELSTTARDVANNIGHVSSSAQQADGVATEGREIVGQAINSINSFANEFSDAADTVTTLRSETENIGGILDVIRGIAEQTNLLALNAAIEAARAGEQGRGFAVVADEVRTLAHRSQESTNEIQELIERLQVQAESAMTKIQSGQQRISGTVAQAEMAGNALSKITESVSSISHMTVQIATAA